MRIVNDKKHQQTCVSIACCWSFHPATIIASQTVCNVIGSDGVYSLALWPQTLRVLTHSQGSVWSEWTQLVVSDYQRHKAKSLCGVKRRWNSGCVSTSGGKVLTHYSGSTNMVKAVRWLVSLFKTSERFLLLGLTLTAVWRSSFHLYMGSASTETLH